MTNTRIIYTGLYGQINYEIIASVFGQMSDGIWENSSRTTGYWECAEYRLAANNEVVLEVGNDYYVFPPYYGRPIRNPYYSKSDTEIRKMFARRIRRVAKINSEHYPMNGLEWKKDNQNYLHYMGGHVIEDVSVADVYKAYEILMNYFS